MAKTLARAFRWRRMLDTGEGSRDCSPYGRVRLGLEKDL
jgi:hypothetical protein